MRDDVAHNLLYYTCSLFEFCSFMLAMIWLIIGITHALTDMCRGVEKASVKLVLVIMILQYEQ